MNANRVILVSPLESGWAVLCAGLEPLVFRSGGRAEAAARQLAACLAELGRAVQLRIMDRTRNVIATQLFPAA